MNSVGNPKNYRIFLSNSKMDGIKAQPYSDRFPWHYIPFLYRLPYLPNNTKMNEKYEKTEPKFSKVLPTVVTLNYLHDGGARNWSRTITAWPLLHVHASLGHGQLHNVNAHGMEPGARQNVAGWMAKRGRLHGARNWGRTITAWPLLHVHASLGHGQLHNVNAHGMEPGARQNVAGCMAKRGRLTRR
jgi:hypothetical protein